MITTGSCQLRKHIIKRNDVYYEMFHALIKFKSYVETAYAQDVAVTPYKDSSMAN